MKFRSIFFSVVTFSLILISCGNQSSRTIANIDGDKITLDYFLATQQYTGYASKSVVQQINILEDFYADALRAHDARQIDFAQKKRAQWRSFLNRQQVILDKIYQKEINDYLVPEDEVRSAYEHSKTERMTRSILVTFRGATNAISSRSKEEALNLIREARSMIESGELTFEEAAREYSDDSSGGYGGYLGYITWGTMVQPFQEAVWDLPLNTISEPVETRYGYHLIEVTDIDTVDIGSFDAEYLNLQDRLLNINRSEVSTREDDLYSIMMDETNYTLYDSVLNRLAYDVFQYVNSQIDLEEGNITDVFGAIKYQPIGEIYGEPIPQQDFEDFLLSLQYANPQTFSRFETFAQSINGYFQQDMLIQFGERHGIFNYKNTQEELRYAEDKTYSDSYLNNVVFAGFSTSEDTLKAFYDRVKDQMYSDSTRFRVREIYVTSHDTAESIFKALQNGGDFAKLATEYTERPSADANGGDLGWFTQDRFGPIGQIMHTMDIGEIRGPLQLGTGWSIIQLMEKTAIAPPPFEEIRSDVRLDYIEQSRPRLIEENIRQLEQKYNCSLNYEILEHV